MDWIVGPTTRDMLTQQAMLKTAPFAEKAPKYQVLWKKTRHGGRLSTEGMLGTRNVLEQP